MSHSPAVKTLIGVAKYGVVAACFVYIGLTIARNSESLRAAELDLRLQPLALSFPFALAYLFGRGLIWHLIVRTVLGHYSLRLDLLSWMSSLAGKYLPGKVVLLLGRVYLYRRHGATAAQISSCFMIEACCSALATLAVFGVAALTRPMEKLGALKFGMSGLAVLLLIVTHPVVLRAGINAVLRVARQSPLALRIRWRHVLGWTALMSLNWLILGMGFYLLLNSVIVVPPNLYLYITGAFAVAGVIGVLALFAPSGIGVREGVLTFVLSNVLSTGMAAIAALLARIWITVAEALCCGAALLMVRSLRKCEQEVEAQEAIDSRSAD